MDGGGGEPSIVGYDTVCFEPVHAASSGMTKNSVSRRTRTRDHPLNSLARDEAAEPNRAEARSDGS